MTTSEGGAASSGEDELLSRLYQQITEREDELLSRLYQQITERQAARFGAGYDIGAGLDRYRAWLGERAADEHSRPEAIQLQGSMALRAALAGTGVSAAAQDPGGPVVADGITQGSTSTSGGPSAGAEWDAVQAVTVLYITHSRSLVRLAALLVHDVATAEEIVQDCFVATHTAWRRIRDNEKALDYLRQCVVNRSRSALQHRVIVDKDAPKPAPDLPTAEQGALTLLERTAVVAAMRSLPPRQREALVLRYYGDLSEAQIAAAMSISRGAVKVHTARAIATLRAVLEIER
jgi:RNA polymerase sigma-70 factor (sigma-E family)